MEFCDDKEAAEAGEAFALTPMEAKQDWCVTLLVAYGPDAGQAKAFTRKIRAEIKASNAMVKRELRPLADGTVSAATQIRFPLDTDDIEVFREKLKKPGIQGFDVAFHPAEVHWSQFKLAVFDLDSTLITCEGIDELAAMMGVGGQVAEITASAMRGEIDFQQSFRKRVGLLCGLEFEKVKQFAASVEIAPGAALLFRVLKSAGYRTAIATGGFDLIASRVQRELGIDDVCANRLDVKDGRLSGEVVTPIIDGEGKAEFVRRLAAQHGISAHEMIVVGDGANDIPMMQQAGLSVAFHAKPKVREVATCSISRAGIDGLLYILQLDQMEVRALTR